MALASTLTRTPAARPIPFPAVTLRPAHRRSAAGSAQVVRLPARPERRVDDPAVAPETACFLVESATAALLATFDAPGLTRAETTRRLRGLIDGHLDLGRLARGAMGAYWNDASAGQRQAFRTLFEAYLGQVLADWFGELGGARFGRPILVETGRHMTVVRLEMIRADGSAHPVMVAVGRATDGALRILDVVAGSVSLSRLVRKDFHALLHGMLATSRP